MWTLEKQTNEPYAFYDNVLTKEEIDHVIERAKPGMAKARVDSLDPTKRNSNINWLLASDPENVTIYQNITAAISHLNTTFFKFDLTYIEDIQFTEYKSEELGHYGSHVDYSYDGVPSMFRKLSFSLLLSDPETYEGGDLLLYPWELTPMPVPRRQGTLVAFPSNMIHEVVPLTKGTRHSLVSWVHGPRFK